MNQEQLPDYMVDQIRYELSFERVMVISNKPPVNDELIADGKIWVHDSSHSPYCRVNRYFDCLTKARSAASKKGGSVYERSHYEAVISGMPVPLRVLAFFCCSQIIGLIQTYLVGI